MVEIFNYWEVLKMPYIKKKFRAKYNGYIKDIANVLNRNSTYYRDGCLNYIISKLLLSTNPSSYADYNSLIGVLECAKLELYRKKVAIYEEKKIIENGGIYDV